MWIEVENLGNLVGKPQLCNHVMSYMLMNLCLSYKLSSFQDAGPLRL